jgi:signal transduction histidine kinase/HAMP domain-containing protein
MTEKIKSAPKPIFLLHFGLKNKLIAIVIGVGTVPLILAMIFSYLQANKSLTQVIGSSFQALAYETSTKIDLLLKEEIRKITHLASHPTLILWVTEQNKYLKQVPHSEIELENREQLQAWRERKTLRLSPATNRASHVLSNFLKNDAYASETTFALFITNSKGILVSSVNFNPRFINTHLSSWEKVISGNSETYIGPLIHNLKTKDYTFEFAVPIKNNEGKVVGVLHRVYAAKEFFTHALETITFGETGHVMLINSDGVVLNCPILPTGHQLDDPELVEAVTGPHTAWAETQGDGHGNKDISIIGYSPLEKTSIYTSASSNHRWYTFAWQASDELFAPTNNLLSWVSGAGLFSVLLIIIMGSLAANKIVRPIRQVQSAAQSIGRGKTVEPLNIKTGDEIESLADEINTMSGLLQKTFSGLEHQVETKTQEVIYLKKYTDTILMSVPEVILILDSQLKIEYANAAFERLTGCLPEEYLKHTLLETSTKHREEVGSLVKELEKYQRGKYRNHSNPSLENTSYKPKDPLAPSGTELNRDTQNTIKLGKQVFAYQFFDVFLEEETERRIGLIMKDITEEKHLLDKLTQAEKLSGLGTLAAGIAHEMNNPLYSIMGFTEAIMEEKQISKIQPLAQKVLDRSRHMASIILNLSGYTRNNDKDTLQPVNINEKIEAAVEMAVMASYTDDIKLKTSLDSVPGVLAKPEEIQQVFLNIISNAVQAMDGKGALTISTRNHNDSVEIKIHDTGPGIPRDYLTKVFDPFFTTKGQGEGTGLGLNIVHNIVKKYGGNIKIESEPGEGTTFVILLPVNGKENS